MATVQIPATIDPTGSQEVWPQLDAFIKARKPGDIVQAPDDATYKCDKDLLFTVPGVIWHWNGAKRITTNDRPYAGPARVNCEILADRKHVRIPNDQPPLSNDINWGYASAAGLIALGAHITLDADRRGGILDRLATKPATGVKITFTSKKDRGRSGFRIMSTAKDFEHYDSAWYGPQENPIFTPFELEAQHGVDLVGADSGVLSGIWSYNSYGDGIYYGADGSKKSQYVEAVGGGIINPARSGVVPTQQIGCSVRRYVLHDIGRTLCNFEPPAADGYSENWSLTDSYLGSHGLTLLSSGGNIGAHVGKITLARNIVVKGAMILWLVVGEPSHQRGPYIIDGNKVISGAEHGGTYPTAALICIDHAVTGSQVINNTGIKLEVRSPTMAVCRFRRSGTVEVYGNDHEGGIEVGPWI